ncbi:ATP phosphoribosyltransferase regulatory subunit [Henriciella aquimarina]|uniref:ATP phosphoribosyltransferase regulatory subunit n=1 Tax=Henriciella aquimarina TaxID=545261 RepID=UPI000A04DB3C|nr:ATP phosphoribosyltransferase regulatory subunit [Henriciella aquimarina]
MSTPEDIFSKLGGEVVDPPIVMPANQPLELSGEAVRARLCVFMGENGEECALRPDLTLPVAMAQAEAGVSSETIKRYAARAFRLPAVAGDPMEFTQVGFERYGAPSTAETDAEAFALVCEAAVAAGVSESETRMGDLAIFPAFVDALNLAPGLAEALKRAFRQVGGVSALLKAKPSQPAHGLAARLKGARPEEARAIVSDIFALSGIQPQGTRTLDEIVEGLLAQAADAEHGGAPDLARQTLEAVMAVDCAPEQAADSLNAIARQAGIDGVDGALARLDERVTKMKTLAPAFLKEARFGTPFGRRFNYYDGFLFELFRPGETAGRKPFGSGGRYDTLLSKLSDGAVDATAIGGVVRPDRLAQGGAS